MAVLCGFKTGILTEWVISANSLEKMSDYLKRQKRYKADFPSII
jgi:hypothetical protein